MSQKALVYTKMKKKSISSKCGQWPALALDHQTHTIRRKEDLFITNLVGIRKSGARSSFVCLPFRKQWQCIVTIFSGSTEYILIKVRFLFLVLLCVFNKRYSVIIYSLYFFYCGNESKKSNVFRAVLMNAMRFLKSSVNYLIIVL